MTHALKFNPTDFTSSWLIAPRIVIHLDFSNYQPHNTNCKYLQTITRLINNGNFSKAANDNKNTIIKIATRTLGTITDILGAGSNLRITHIDPSNRFIKFFPWLCLLLTLLMLASFRPVGPPLSISPNPALQRRGENAGTPAFARRGALIPLLCKERLGEVDLLKHFLSFWHHYTQAMSEALQSFPKNALQKSLSLGLIAVIFLTSIPIPAFAATAETSFFYYHHGDHLGSTNVITEGNTSAIHSGITYAKGDVVQRFEYSPYGQESYVLNPSLDLEVSYTGQTYDVESGLYFYNSRYYNPQLGRFIQPDTIIPNPTNLQAYNRYSYVSNNPLKYTDPTGHNWFTSAWNSVFGGTTGGTSLAGQIMTVGSINYQEIPQSTHYEGPTDAQPKSPLQNVAQQEKEQALPLATDGIPSEGFGVVKDSYDQIGFSNTEIILAVVAFVGLTAVIYTGLGRIAVVAGAVGFAKTHPEAIEGFAGDGAIIVENSLMKWPANRGFLIGEGGQASILPGQILDRFGGAGGSFLSPANTPAMARSLAPGSELFPLNSYEVLKAFEASAGRAAPWFYQPGSGLQFDLGTRTVQDLVDAGILRPLQ